MYRYKLGLWALVGLLYLLASQASHAGIFDPKLKWNTIKTDHFNIHFHDGTEGLAKKLAVIVEEVHTDMSSRYDWKPFGRTEVLLTDITDVSNASAATLPYNYILLYVNAPDADSALSNFEDWIRDLFIHEYTHILHIDKTDGIAKPFRWVLGKIVSPNGLTPGWVREGIAVWEESSKGQGRNHSSFSEMMLRTDILNGQFLKMDELAGVQEDWPTFNAAYIYGGQFWQFLSDRYGPEKVQEFITRYGSSIWLFSLNNKARKVYDDKNFFKLRKEWQASLENKYQNLKKQLEAEGLSSLEDFIHAEKENISLPTLSPDGTFLVYLRTHKKGPVEIRRRNIDGSNDSLLIKNKNATSISFSPDASKIYISSMGAYKKNTFYDISEIDLATKQSKKLTSGKRANHPTVSPDGKNIVFVRNNAASTQLYIYSFEDKKIRPLSQAPNYTQFSHPEYSPDGKSIVVSMKYQGQRDLILFDIKSKKYRYLTQDQASETRPQFSKNGRYIYYSSDKTGISNIYRLDLKTNQSKKLTNVLTGLFRPQVHGNTLIAKHYYGKGYDIKKINLNENENGTQLSSCKGKKCMNPSQWNSFTASEENPSIEDLKSDLDVKDYNPFKKLFVPRYIMPGFVFNDSSLLFSAAIQSNDPLFRHRWNAAITYRTDAKHIGWNFLYSYSRYKPLYYLGGYDYATGYGDLYGIGEDFFETRRRFFAGASYPFKNQQISGYYFFEKRTSSSTVPTTAVSAPSLGNFSGFGLSYKWNRSKKYTGKISREWGPRVKLNIEFTNEIFGSSSSNEQIIVSGDFREYIPMWYNKDHYLAFRLAGGSTWGDSLFQGTFRLGSAIGEGPLQTTSSRILQLRGLPQITFSGDKGVLASAEYRFPIYSVQRGLGTGPIFLNGIHAAVFADYGTVWNNTFSFDNFLLGVGAEIRGDFVLGYGLPVTARLGYGIIVRGRRFVRRFSDPITGASLKNGALIMELGTSF